jgi:hypothetical protein
MNFIGAGGGGGVGCAVVSLETLAQDPRNEIMNLRVNQFTLFLSPVLPYTGPETGLVEDTLIWSSEQLTLPEFGVELVTKLFFRRTLRCGQSVPC